MKRKQLKKVLALTAVAAMAVGLLAGCGGSKKEAPSTGGSAPTEAAGGETTIKFGIHVANPQEQEPVTYQIVEAFNKKYAGQYKVEFEASDTEAHSKNMKLAASNGTLPEIFHVDSSEAPEYADGGYLLDMSDFLSENSDINTALNGMADAFNNGEIQYGLPYQCNVQGIFYNKKVFDDAGVSYPTNTTTFDEFLDIVKQLKAKGVTPLAIGSKNSSYAMWEFNDFLSKYGWEENMDKTSTGEMKYNNPDMVACFEKLKALADAGAFPDNMATIEYFDAKQLFDEGQAAMFGTGQWDCAEFDENIGENIGFTWGPQFKDSSYSQEVAMKVPSAPLVVSAKVDEDEAKKAAVYEFMKFYYSKEAAEISYKGSIFPATNYEGVQADDTQYAMNAMLAALAEGWKSPAAAPDQTLSSAVQEALYNSMFGVMQGTYTPEAALDAMDDTAAYQ